MRRIALSLTAAVVVLAVGAPASPSLAEAPAKKPAAARAKPKPKPAAPAPPPYTPQERMKTSDEVKQGVGGAVTTPLRDLGMSRVQIPDVLLAALSDPYARPPKGYTCRYLTALVRPLDDVLGPDIDLRPVDDENLVDRGKILGVAADVGASALIPFRGVVRKISGAEAHDRLVQSAYVAGSVRRAYLKGLGESKGCMPPATPSHERAGSEPVEDKRRLPMPKFPTKTSDASQTSGGTSPAAPRK